jgi:hypothetical protein
VMNPHPRNATRIGAAVDVPGCTGRPYHRGLAT